MKTRVIQDEPTREEGSRDFLQMLRVGRSVRPRRRLEVGLLAQDRAVQPA